MDNIHYFIAAIGVQQDYESLATHLETHKKGFSSVDKESKGVINKATNSMLISLKSKNYKSEIELQEIEIRIKKSLHKILDPSIQDSELDNLFLTRAIMNQNSGKELIMTISKNDQPLTIEKLNQFTKDFKDNLSSLEQLYKNKEIDMSTFFNRGSDLCGVVLDMAKKEQSNIGIGQSVKNLLYFVASWFSSHFKDFIKEKEIKNELMNNMQEISNKFISEIDNIKKKENEGIIKFESMLPKILSFSLFHYKLNGIDCQGDQAGDIFFGKSALFAVKEPETIFKSHEIQDDGMLRKFSIDALRLGPELDITDGKTITSYKRIGDKGSGEVTKLLNTITSALNSKRDTQWIKALQACLNQSVLNGTIGMIRVGMSIPGMESQTGGIEELDCKSTQKPLRFKATLNRDLETGEIKSVNITVNFSNDLYIMENKTIENIVKMEMNYNISIQNDELVMVDLCPEFTINQAAVDKARSELSLLNQIIPSS